MRHFAIICALAALTPALAARADEAAPANGKQRVAVLPFQAGQGVAAETATMTADFFIAEARKTPNLEVVSTAEVTQLLGFERQRLLMGCSDSECAVEIAGALGVDSIVIGNLAQVGKRTVISIKRMGARNAGNLGQFTEAYERTEQAGDEVLLDLAVRAARAIFAANANASATGEVSTVPAVSSDAGPPPPKEKQPYSFGSFFYCGDNFSGWGPFNGCNAGDTIGVQAGWLGFFSYATGTARGAQVSFIATYAPEVRGAQLSPFVNYAREVHGAQLGWVNIGRNVSGLQYGFFNYADTLKGAQLGLINVIRHDGMLPIFVLFNAGW